jgi:hypothetical protein
LLGRWGFSSHFAPLAAVEVNALEIHGSQHAGAAAAGVAA